jgi:hypothetical protein
MKVKVLMFRSWCFRLDGAKVQCRGFEVRPINDIGFLANFETKAALESIVC